MEEKTVYPSKRKLGKITKPQAGGCSQAVAVTS